jgi:hypothetical protein
MQDNGNFHEIIFSLRKLCRLHTTFNYQNLTYTNYSKVARYALSSFYSLYKLLFDVGLIADSGLTCRSVKRLLTVQSDHARLFP